MSDPAPDLFDEVTGVRAFRVSNGKLLGKFSKIEWFPGQNSAMCSPESFIYPQYTFPEEHDAPSLHCKCGLHVYYDETTADLSRSHGYVVGIVSCWGTLIPHDDGFRAQYARVLALSDHFRRSSTVEVARRFDIPLVQKMDRLMEWNSMPFPLSRRA